MKLIFKIIGWISALGVIVGFITTMIIVNKKDEVQVPPPNTENLKPYGWNQKNPSINSKIKYLKIEDEYSLYSNTTSS